MKKNLQFTIFLTILFIFVISPVDAFTAKNLDITVQDSTDAVITFDYDLTWYENIAVFSRIADPKVELAKAMKSQFGKPVEVVSVSQNQARLVIHNFASRQEADGKSSLATPALSFKNAEKLLKQYWFARFISPDFSPEITRVSFPDGYSEEFYNQDQIPSVYHSMEISV